MDELEIEGKKYLSSRRAAREHKYHIDYIGQLIRAGRVEGKKVGRSWYVEAESLKSYLLAENQSQPAPVAQAVSAPLAAPLVEKPQITEAPAQQPVMWVAAQPTVEEKILITSATEEPRAPSSSEENSESERRVLFNAPAPAPARPRTLTYVEDDAPMLPVLDGRRRANADFVAVPVRKVTEPEPNEIEREEPAIEVFSKPKKLFLTDKRLGALALAALATLILTAIGGAAVANSIKVHEGQTASVGMTIK